MNPREKKLVAVVGVVLGALALHGLWRMYRSTHAELDRKIVSRTNSLEEVKLQRLQAKVAEEDWKGISRQTLSLDEKEAKTLLRDELVRLTREAGLPDAKPDLQMVRSWSRYGVRVLNASVTAEGALDSIMKLLFNLYRQPFLVRVKTFDLTPIEEKRGSSPGDRNAPPQPTGRFTMTLRLDTLLMPGSPRVPLSALKVADLSGEQRREMPRTELASLDAYKAIKPDLFERYKPPPPPPSNLRPSFPGHNATVEWQDNETLKWSAANARQYEIYFADEEPLGDAKGTINSMNWRPPGKLEYDRKYYWKIVAIGEGGRTEGDIWSFTPVEPKRAVPTQVVTPPPPPTPVLSDKVVQGIMSSPLIQAVVLQDARNKNAEPVRVEVDEKLNLGTLVFVHPSGAVTEEQDGTRRFHPIGSVVGDGPELTEETYPLVFHELVKLEQRSARTSEGLDDGVPASEPAAEVGTVGMAR